MRIAIVVLPLVACGGGSSSVDAPAVVDGVASVDGVLPPDAGGPPDATIPPDACSETWGGVPVGGSDPTHNLHPALVLDDGDVAHMVTSGAELHYWTGPIGGPFADETIVDVGSPYDTAIVRATDGGVHVMVYRLVGRNLEHAYRPPGGGWTIEAVDSMGDVGYSLDLAIDSVGGLHVSYFRLDDHAVRYAHRSPAGTWTTETVGSSDPGIGFIG